MDDRTIRTSGEFLALYQGGAAGGTEEWRSREVTEDVWRELLEQGFPVETLLLNKRLPVGLLRTLATDPDPRIRSMVADKRAAGPLLAELARDPEVCVRLRVAWNAKVSRELLQFLTGDATVQVRETARSRLSKGRS